MQKIDSALVAHRYPIERLMISQLIRDQNPDMQISEAIDWSQLLQKLQNGQEFELLLLDLSLLSSTSLTKLKLLLSQHRSLKAITISRKHHRIPAPLLRRSGVSGNITSRDDQQTLISAVNQVLASNTWFSEWDSPDYCDPVAPENFDRLSRQEQRVLKLLDQGMMNKQIAGQLDLSPHTAKAHVCSVLRKLDVKNRTRAVLAYRQFQLGQATPTIN